jgi:hypothetical protein
MHDDRSATGRFIAQAACDAKKNCCLTSRSGTRYPFRTSLGFAVGRNNGNIPDAARSAHRPVSSINPNLDSNFGDSTISLWKGNVRASCSTSRLVSGWLGCWTTLQTWPFGRRNRAKAHRFLRPSAPSCGPLTAVACLARRLAVSVRRIAPSCALSLLWALFFHRATHPRGRVS